MTEGSEDSAEGDEAEAAGAACGEMLELVSESLEVIEVAAEGARAEVAGTACGEVLDDPAAAKLLGGDVQNEAKVDEDGVTSQIEENVEVVVNFDALAGLDKSENEAKSGKNEAKFGGQANTGGVVESGGADGPKAERESGPVGLLCHHEGWGAVAEEGEGAESSGTEGGGVAGAAAADAGVQKEWAAERGGRAQDY